MAGSMRRLLILATVAVTMAIALAGCVPPSRYVSLGDSYTAGPLIAAQRRDPAGCLRSTNNYPSLVAPSLTTTEHRDPSCSGAQTKDMTAPQAVDPDGPNPPQFDSLTADTTVVTLGIGGNDIGFTEIAKTCGQKGVNDPGGTPCKAFYTAGGTDQIAQRINDTAPKVRAVLAEIKRRSPRAKVFLVGYPAIIPETLTLASWSACYPVLPIAFGDMGWLRDDVEKRLNSMLRSEATAAGVTYVDTYTSSIGHDACQAPVVRWVEPVVPADGAAPVHPNARGMEGTKVAVLASMRANGVPTR